MRLKDINNKINSIKNIFEITKAIEVVSAIRMKNAQRLALDSRLFSQAALRILMRVSEYQKEIESKSIFFKANKGKPVLAVVVSSDKGFCSAFNKNILNFSVREINQEKNIEIMAIGAKAIKFFKKNNYKVLVEFSGIGNYGEFEEVKPIADLLIRYFREGKFEKILFFYTDFISTFYQKPTKVQILPLNIESIEQMLKEYELKKRKDVNQEQFYLPEDERINYVLEPSPQEVFDNMVPQLLEYLVYHFILEANASEHSARMMAMKNASENAKEIIAELRLEGNKARQAQITAEVTEISTAKEVTK